MTDRVREAEAGSLSLVIKPSLGRYGTAAGIGLENFSLIGKCDGEYVTLQTKDSASLKPTEELRE